MSAIINKLTSYNKISILLIVILGILGCKNEKNIVTTKLKVETPNSMVWVEGKTFLQGAKVSDEYAMHREKPAHEVTVDGFFIDITEVTNKQYKAFVDATGYITVAEREIDWEEMKKELPEGTPKPHDSILQPGSLIFNKNVNAVVNMQNYGQWWTWKIGADWKHPQGPQSSIEGQDNYPVVHIAYEDALAYCKWANRRLPTEAEWESAAQGSNVDAIFTWGNNAEYLNQKANTWQGVFPTVNEPIDGYKYIAPVKSFEPNTIGLYDMSGNVWEITSDLFNINYYNELGNSKAIVNPKGANKSFNPDNPYAKERVIKGGSFLCHASYCASFRISAKMGMTPDSGADHIGFRTVVTQEMLSVKK
jgi:formylglycine-generating enzyme required for sulfatase activity